MFLFAGLLVMLGSIGWPPDLVASLIIPIAVLWCARAELTASSIVTAIAVVALTVLLVATATPLTFALVGLPVLWFAYQKSEGFESSLQVQREVALALVQQRREGRVMVPADDDEAWGW